MSDVDLGTYVSGWDKSGRQLRSFNDSTIQAQIDRALADLGPDRKGAVIATVTSGSVDAPGSINLAVVAKPFGSENWSVVGMLGKELSSDSWDAAASIRYTW